MFLSDARQPKERPSHYIYICLNANKFVSLSFFSLIKRIYPRVSTKPLPNDAKSPLPVDVRRSKTLLLKLFNYLIRRQASTWGGGGVPSYKKDGGACRKISTTHLKGTRILFYGRVPNSFPPLRGTNSITTNFITGTANCNSRKHNFRTVSSQALFESIVINLTEATLAAVIFGFSTLRGTNPQI